jgi:hypothetical protein
MGLGLSAKPSLAAVARAGKSQLFFRCKPSAQFEQAGWPECCGPGQAPISEERYATRIAAASAAPACIVAASKLYTLIHAARISGVKASPKPLFNAHKRTFLKIRVNLFYHRPALISFITLSAREGADGQAVVYPLLRGSSATRGVAPKQHRGPHVNLFYHP